ncbi:hypothetical protein D1007_47295 [Hordeum vulgare]|nr:hypothetical protein D1007_47295 [Hordeum vulgare]
MGRTCVYVHHVDKDAFLKGNIDPDPDELDMVFDLCPSYGELLEQVRKDLNWMDPSDVVEFDGRHNVGFGTHIRLKTMRVNSEQRWLAYKDTVAESLDKALELFAIKTNVPNLLDLNRVASSIVEAIPATINEEANIEPLSCVYEANEEVNIEHEPLVEANDEHDDDDNDGNVLHDNNLGDLDKYNLQETMDHSIPYSRGYASESDDEGPDEEVDEEGFTTKEAEAFTNVLKRDHRTPLFEDLSLADEAVVDGGEGILFGVRPPSHRDTHGKNIILPGSKFETFFEQKMWLDEYSVTHYRPHKVVHSNMKLRYTVACEDRGCPWIVRARPWKGGPGWNIVSCMPHMCRGKRVDGALSSQSHRQLTSEFIAYRLSNSISSLPTMSIKSVQDLVKALFHYEVKYGGLEFLNRHIELRAKWARAYDEDGRRYGQMTSNMAECFNRVLKGVHALPVTAIVQYTFDKLRAYFLKYSQETDDQIAEENKKKYKYQFPPKVDKWMVFQSRKADSQTATLYNNEDWTYEVNEPRGTTNDGQQHGNRAFKVSLSLCDCSCGRPRYGRFSTQQGKSGVGEEKDATSEEQRLMERAAKKLREEDAAEARKKKDEQHKAKMDEEWQMFLEHKRYEARIKENERKTLEKRKKEYEVNFKKMWADAAAKREREHQRFTERVKEEASKMRKREEEEEEERKKKKGKGPCSTQ